MRKLEYDHQQGFAPSRKENPGKRSIPVSEQAICPDMKLITLDKVLRSLEEMEPRVKVPDTIRDKV